MSDSLSTMLLGQRVKYLIGNHPNTQLVPGIVVAVWVDSKESVRADALMVAISSRPGNYLDIRPANRIMLADDPADPPLTLETTP